MYMVMRPLTPLIALIALAGPAPALAAPAAGVDIGPAAQPKASLTAELDQVKALGARVARVGIDWPALEPTAAGQRDPEYLGLLDHLAAQARRRGLKLLPVIQGSPCWASSAPADVRSRCGQPGYAGQEAGAYPPTDPADYGAVVGFLVGRYASALAAVEIWNEPDHANEDYFKGPDKPQRYAALLRAAYGAAKQASRGVPVLAGSLVGADGRFLRALYAAGIKGSYDGLAVHYYDIVLGSLRTIRAVQRAAGDSKPLWLTEFGWTSCSPRRTQGGHACVSRATQGANLADSFDALRTASWVRAAVVYNLYDTRQYSFGLIGPDGKRKPAFTRLAATLRRPARPRAPRLRLARRAGAVVASGSGPAGDNYELDVHRGGRLVYKAILRLSRANRFSLRLPAQLGTSGLTVRVYQYWSKRSATARI